MHRDAIASLTRVVAGCQTRWAEPPSAGVPRVYFANHSSNLDALLLWSSLPRACRRRCRVLAAEDYWGQNKLRRWVACRCFRAILVDRTRVTRRNNPLRPVKACIDAGGSVIIFPEGTRDAGDEIGPFKPGLWHIARQSPDAQLVPVWIENLSRVLPKGEVLPVPLLVAASFGAPLGRESMADKQAFLEHARRAVIDLKEEAA